MIVTTYTCDKCKKTQANSKQMWWIRIIVDTSEHSSTSYARIKRYWCRDCCNEFNLVTDPPQTVPAAPQPTFEETLRELIREEISNA